MDTERAQIHRWRAFAVLAVSYFMTIVDLTIVNVALPTIGRDLHFSESDLQWVVTAYGLTFGGFLLLGGRVADLLGRRRILMLGLAVFTAASLGAGLASSDGFLIAMRGLQGFGAAVVLPAALSIVMNMFEEGADRNKALGLWAGSGPPGAIQGVEHEELFTLDEERGCLVETGTKTSEADEVSGFAPPGDIHRVRNAGDETAISIHIYGTDVSRIGSSVRRYYEQPMVPA